MGISSNIYRASLKVAIFPHIARNEVLTTALESHSLLIILPWSFSPELRSQIAAIALKMNENIKLAK